MIFLWNTKIAAELNPSLQNQASNQPRRSRDIQANIRAPGYDIEEGQYTTSPFSQMHSNSLNTVDPEAAPEYDIKNNGYTQKQQAPFSGMSSASFDMQAIIRQMGTIKDTDPEAAPKHNIAERGYTQNQEAPFSDMQSSSFDMQAIIQQMDPEAAPEYDIEKSGTQNQENPFSEMPAASFSGMGESSFNI